MKSPVAYVDTGAFIAFRDISDTYHPLFRQLFQSPSPLLTTTLVIAEGHAWFVKRYGPQRAFEFLDLVNSIKTLKIFPIAQKEMQDARKYLQKFSDQKLTLVDACGLVLMEQNKIKVCWSMDHHLGLTGVPLVIHQ